MLATSEETSWVALEHCNVVWAWIPNFSRDHYVSNIMKYTFPEWVDSCAIFQPYNYNVVNNAVRYGFYLHIAFGNWTSYMGDDLYKPLSTYIEEVQRIRKEFKDRVDAKPPLSVPFPGDRLAIAVEK